MEEYGPNWCQKKIRGLWIDAEVLYPNEDKKTRWRILRIWGMVGGCRGIFYKGVEESSST